MKIHTVVKNLEGSYEIHLATYLVVTGISDYGAIILYSHYCKNKWINMRMLIVFYAGVFPLYDGDRSQFPVEV